jgi:hypothetical protein
MAQQSPVPAATAVLDQIKERQDEYRQICDRRGGRGLYPALDTVCLQFVNFPTHIILFLIVDHVLLLTIYA